MTVMNKLARKVTKRIAQQCVHDGGNLKKEENAITKSLFKDGISNISNTELREELQDNIELYFEYLIKCISKYSSDKEILESTNDGSFNKEGVSAPSENNQLVKKQHICVGSLMKSLEKIPIDDINQQVQMFDSSLSLLSREKRSLYWMTLLDRLLVVADMFNIVKILNIYLSKLAPEVEKCLNKHKIKRATKLQEHLKNCFTVLMTRHVQPMDQKKKSKITVKDLVSSLVSLYLDLCSLINGDESPKKKEVGFINYIMKYFGTSCLDVLLQQTGDVSLPFTVHFARFCLNTPPSLNDCAQYLRYILCVVKFKKQIPNVFEHAKNVPAPFGFLDWLWCQNREISAWMPDDKKFRGRQITNFLLTETTEELNTLLLDVLTVDLSSAISHTNKDEDGTSLQTPDVTSYVNVEPSVGENIEDVIFCVDRKGEEKNKQETVVDEIVEDVRVLDLTDELCDNDRSSDESDIVILTDEEDNVTKSKQSPQKKKQGIVQNKQSEIKTEDTDQKIKCINKKDNMLTEDQAGKIEAVFEKGAENSDVEVYEIDLESITKEKACVKEIKNESRRKSTKSGESFKNISPVRKHFNTDTTEKIENPTEHSQRKKHLEEEKQVMLDVSNQRTNGRDVIVDVAEKDVGYISDDESVQVIDVDAPVQSQSNSSQPVSPSKLNLVKSSPSKLNLVKSSPSKTKLVKTSPTKKTQTPVSSPFEKRPLETFSVTFDISSDEEGKISFSPLISKLSSPVQNVSEKPEVTKIKCVKHLDLSQEEVEGFSAESASGNALLSERSPKVSPRKRKQNENVSESETARKKSLNSERELNERDSEISLTSKKQNMEVTSSEGNNLETSTTSNETPELLQNSTCKQQTISLENNKLSPCKHKHNTSSDNLVSSSVNPDSAVQKIKTSVKGAAEMELSSFDNPDSLDLEGQLLSPSKSLDSSRIKPCSPVCSAVKSSQIENKHLEKTDVSPRRQESPSKLKRSTRKKSIAQAHGEGALPKTLVIDEKKPESKECDEKDVSRKRTSPQKRGNVKTPRKSVSSQKELKHVEVEKVPRKKAKAADVQTESTKVQKVPSSARKSDDKKVQQRRYSLRSRRDSLSN